MPLQTVADGFTFTEGPRWHDGALWFSDCYGPAVNRLDPADGTVTTVAALAGVPSGLGWLPDGTLLVATGADRSLHRLQADGSVVLHADLSDLAPGSVNDMVVGIDGRAYVGNHGFNLHAGEKPRPTVLILVEPTGGARVVADDLRFPNGTVLSPDGTMLVVAETFGGRLTAFTVAADGSLVDRRTFASLPAGAAPDGIALDEAGAVWVASPPTGEYLRVADGGEVLDRIPAGKGRMAIACALGGADRRTLYCCTSSTFTPAECVERRDARIEAIAVDVPGAGLP